MTRPDGEIRADLRVDTDKVPDDVDRGLDKAGKQAERDLKDTGEKFGDAVSEGMERRLEKSGPDLARSVQRSLDKETVVTKVTYEFDQSGNISRRWVTRVARDMEQAVRREAGAAGGGAFGGVSSGIRDAIGAGFNVSGRSPLIAALVPVIGFIAELVVGLVAALEGVIALLAIVPSLIGGIILQGGVLFLVFQGLGEVIGKAFAAKNAQELNEALVGLNQQTRDFVVSLLPLKAFFADLKEIATSQFFGAFGDSLMIAQRALDGIARIGVGNIAQALGGLLGALVQFFASPEFITFLNTLIPSTVKWINEFGPALLKFLTGLADLGAAVAPFLDWFGEGFNQVLADLGGWLTRISNDPDFLLWLEDMKTTLTLTGDLFGAILLLLTTLFNTLNEAGGQEVLKQLVQQLQVLAYVLSTEVGQKGLKFFLGVIVALSAALIGIIIIVLFLAASWQAFWDWLLNVAFPAIGDFFTNTIPGWFEGFKEIVTNFFKHLLDEPERWLNNITGFFRDLPETIRQAVGDLGNVLVDAGKQLLQGLMNGIRSRFPDLGNIGSQVAGIIAKYIPHSPAEEGPLSGKGDPMRSGQEIVRRLAMGMEMETPALATASNNVASQVILGPGSVQMNFNGVPTASQAGGIGRAAGNGIVDQLAIRNTRLGIRTL